MLSPSSSFRLLLPTSGLLNELRSFWDCTDYNSTDFALIFRSLVVGIQRINKEKKKKEKKLGNTLLSIWLVHYLRLWSNTHLLLWSENVENRNKKTVVNSRFRSKNLTNKSRGCTWKYKKSIQVRAILHWEIVFAWKTSLQRNYLRVYFNKLWMLMVINVTLTSWQLSAIDKTQMLLFNKLKSFLIFKTLSAKALNVFLKSLSKLGQFCFRVHKP